MPVLLPVVVGKKLTCTVQVELTATGPAVQVSLSLKSPVVTIRLIDREAPPVFVTVIVCAALAVATACAAKVSAAGFREIADCITVLAVSNGICQMPRPYVAARSSP